MRVDRKAVARMLAACCIGFLSHVEAADPGAAGAAAPHPTAAPALQVENLRAAVATLDASFPTEYEVKLSQAEFVRLVTWVDLNLPYYGTYFGKRNLKYQGQPDFRPTPTLESACGTHCRGHDRGVESDH